MESGRLPRDISEQIDAHGRAAERLNGVDCAVLVKSEDRRAALQHEKGFGLGRIAVTMRGDIGPFQHHVQETVRVVLGAGVEVVIGAPPRRLARPLQQRGDQSRIQKLYALHLFHHRG